MKYLLYLGLAFVFFANSCNTGENDNNQQLDAKVLKINETTYFKTLYPKLLNDVVSSHIIMQIHEGLVKFDTKHMTVIPAIANSWELEKDTIYTFHLREDAYFHDNDCFDGGEGRQITAHDFVYTFELLCSKSEGELNFVGLYDNIVGAIEYFNASETAKPDFGIKGVVAIDDFTLQISLVKPVPIFLALMANPVSSVLPKEGIIKYGKDNYVGAGPFYLAEMPQKSEKLILLKNPKYKRTDVTDVALPHLDSLIISFVESTQKEISMLENDELDIVLDLPTEYINRFLESHKGDFESNPPKYIMEHSGNEENKFNIKRSYVNGLYFNEMNYIDFSVVNIIESTYFSAKENTSKE
ncbi:MAG TPA: hypothetical protein DDX39_01940 [Bacteroidales bacterium]|nr:MAG: hypothetical protein A2W98_08560 [Bacteroidetes bacterium GWF2_33_38]OFY74107.1 MAG: hypothetical protein A2265_10225 [Bacteroidetes bacterium RIFOXYA12_FULL_33_9]OFY90283.1 MAG: hypothetical protein A2236_04430 [Bacteroidetes bacterium RIFOXYA2_FULL_33_7]HBF87374.1 hypothetical protein [Bacteroidales bacterium]